MELITATPVLADFCERAAGHDFVTVDTEFLRETTYWPKLCLLQAATKDELAESLGVSVKEVQTLLQANADNYSLNAELDDESHTELADVIGVEVISNTPITDANDKTWTMKQFAAAQKAYVTPTLIFLRHDGKAMLRIVGYYPPEKFRAVMDYVLKAHYERESFSAFLARTKITGEAGPLIRDTELFASPPYVLDRRAGAARRPLLVLLERANCASCTAFHRNVLNSPPIRALVKKYQAAQIDMDDAQSTIVIPSGERLSPKQWAERLELAYAPALVFFDERGQEVYRLDSELLRERTEGSLQLVLEKGYLEEPQLQRWRNLKGRYRAP